MISRILVKMAGVTCICVMSLTSFVQSAGAQQDSPTRGALGDTQWYDAASGSIKPVAVREFTDDSVNRGSRWLPKPKKLKKQSDPLSSTTTQAAAPNGIFGSDVTIGNAIGWLILALVICILVGGLVYAFSRAEIDMDGQQNNTKPRGEDNATPDEQTLQRIKHLPAELRRTDVNLRSESRRLMEEGKYDQAIILLLGHQLLMLDRAALLRLSRGKTNGRYVRETRSVDPQIAMILRQTTTAFESSYFGRHPLDSSTFKQLWQANAQMESLIATREEVAA